LLATIGHHSWIHEVGLIGLSSNVSERQRALQLITFVGSIEAVQSLSQELLQQGIQGQALRLPPNQIRLNPITGLGQWHFVPILDSEQQGFRAPQAAKKNIFDHGIKGVRRLMLCNHPNHILSSPAANGARVV